MKGPSFSELEGRYRRYLASARGLSPASIANHIWVFRKFRDFLKARRVRAARRVTLDLAYAFLEQLAHGYARRSMATMHGSVTRILRFLRFSRIAPRDLSEDMIAPRTWSLSGIPKGFTDDDIAHMLTAFRTETPYDYRERAVMVLFIYYGLRPGEVRQMTLDDIDWRNKTITIRERKNRMPLVLPLLPPVEEALRGYLEHFRPHGLRTRSLFVTIARRSRAPFKEGRHAGHRGGIPPPLRPQGLRDHIPAYAGHAPHQQRREPRGHSGRPRSPAHRQRPYLRQGPLGSLARGRPESFTAVVRASHGQL